MAGRDKQRRKQERPGKGKPEAEDRPLLETPTGRAAARNPEDVLPESPAEEGAPAQDTSAQPLSGTTAPVPDSNRDEDLEGLDETEAAVRRRAEAPLPAAEGGEEEEAPEEVEVRRGRAVGNKRQDQG